ncbi:hypothetical protein BDZ94DRAFT_1252697 [Collybia nuda]|uniref:Uncharacterized protein n=1 Tax=Collybia nuda TaxID=64659 RepID=A0A9P5YB00_9AGAR|nr:hypothetical protein BDZ94DRAFT_1252697 [Collybia nuda]
MDSRRGGTRHPDRPTPVPAPKSHFSSRSPESRRWCIIILVLVVRMLTATRSISASELVSEPVMIL